MSLESVTEEYKIRNNVHELTEYDLKLIKSITNLRNKYAIELTKRKCSIFLKEPIVVSVFDKSTKKKELKKAETKSTACVAICEAVQMNGNACKAKSKPGEKFCGRHCKK